MHWLLMFFRTLAMGEVLKPLLKRIVMFLGFTAVTYVGVGALMESVKDQFIAAYSGIGADVLVYLSLAKVDQALSILLSAWAAKLTIKGLTAAGSIQKVLWKPFQQGDMFS